MINKCAKCGQECPEGYLYCWSCSHKANTETESSYGVREILNRKVKEE